MHLYIFEVQSEILTSQFVEDKVLQIVDQLDILLTFASDFILTIDGEGIDQCIRTNDSQEIHLFVNIYNKFFIGFSNDMFLDVVVNILLCFEWESFLL